MAYLLLADDDGDLAWAIAHWLRSEGHEVSVVSNGLAALALVQERRPNVVILDVVMPQLDGLEVCRRLRSDPASALIPVLFLTGKGSVEDRVRGLDGGGDDYLVKPFDFRELRSRVDALIRRSHLGTAPRTCELVVGPLSLDLNARRLSTRQRTVPLTPVQFKLLCYLMRHVGSVLSERELLQQIWCSPLETTDLSLVRWHIKKLRERIEPDPHHPRYLRTIPRHGYILAAPEEPAEPQAEALGQMAPEAPEPPAPCASMERC